MGVGREKVSFQIQRPEATEGAEKKETRKTLKERRKGENVRKRLRKIERLAVGYNERTKVTRQERIASKIKSSQIKVDLRWFLQLQLNSQTR